MFSPLFSSLLQLKSEWPIVCHLWLVIVSQRETLLTPHPLTSCPSSSLTPSSSLSPSLMQPIAWSSAVSLIRGHRGDSLTRRHKPVTSCVCVCVCLACQLVCLCSYWISFHLQAKWILHLQPLPISPPSSPLLTHIHTHLLWTHYLISPAPLWLLMYFILPLIINFILGIKLADYDFFYEVNSSPATDRLRVQLQTLSSVGYSTTYEVSCSGGR